MSTLSSILQALLGTGILGTAVLVLTYAIYRMALHETLLFGTVRKQGDKYTYSFFIQNLEEVAFKGPLRIIVSDRRSTSGETTPMSIRAYCGPQHIVCKCDCADDRGAGARVWWAQLEELPAFDTWKFEYETKSTWLDLDIDTGEENTTLRYKLIRDISGRHLSLRAGEGLVSEFRGLSVTPSLALFIVIALAMTLGYVGSVILLNFFAIALRVPDFRLLPVDLLVVSLIWLFLWIGYRRIQRPVYPIIQGHAYETEVKPPLDCHNK